jgi:UDP-glucose 4-epimerase
VKRKQQCPDRILKAEYPQMDVLVVGGAGYIGSHMAKMLLDCGHQVTVFDDLSTGSKAALIGGAFVHGSLSARSALKKLFAARDFDAVMHFASFIQVGESTRRPDKYYRNNLINTVNLLDAMVAANVRHFIFSSSAAIFGEPEYGPIDERHPKSPINPYGRTKYMVEQILADYDGAYGLKSVCLRYFNAAGGDPSGHLGECHQPETHLIPLLLQVASGRRRSIDIFGRDYDTPDGTCIRDYVHVVDLCQAHLLALDHLLKTGRSAAYNLGNGNGFSVLQVIDAVQHVTRRRLHVVDAGRRSGDCALLVADSTLARRELSWEPKYHDLDTIVAHAWSWERKLAAT